MKKFGLLLAGGIAAMILLTSIVPMVALAISLLILYYIYKQFVKTNTTSGKIALGIIGFFVLMASISNAPAIIGVVAAYVLYLVYKNWNNKKHSISKNDADPFVNFEKQWMELNK